MQTKPLFIKRIVFILLQLLVFTNLFAQDPSMDSIDDIYIVESSSPALQTIVLSGLSGTTPLSLSATSSNTGLIPTADMHYNTSDTTLTFTPVADTNGQSIISITITNGNGTTADSSFVVYVNGKPNFESSNSVSFEENTSGTVIDVNATDPEDSTVTYSLETSIDDKNLFSINPTTGEITFVNPPDYENPIDENTDNDYIITVAAIDNGAPAASDTMQITISVTDVNENPIAENDTTYNTSEDVILTIAAPGVLVNDEDPESAIITTTLNSGSEINGVVTLNENGSFTFEPDTNSYGTGSFSYYVTDETGHTSNTATVKITIDAVNDAPIITSNDTVTINENLTTVSTVTTTDEENDNINYSVSAGVDSTLFSITTTGDISFKNAPDYENPLDDGADNIYNIRVTATDDGTPTAESTTQDLTIIVRDVNESAPVFTSPDTTTVNENTTSVITVVANDTENSDITYSLLAGTNDNDNFTISESSGVLVFTGAPDYENPTDANTNNEYIVNVVASDNQNPPQTTTQTITITVVDINEGAPIFSSATNISVEENQTATLTIVATDPEGNDITYLLEEDVDDNNLFSIGSSTGVLTFNSAPDFEAYSNGNGDNNYIVTVSASDNQINPDTTTQQITITVTDINEAPVAVSDTIYTNEDTPYIITESSLILNDSDQDGNTLTFNRSDSTSNGALVYNNDQTYTYTPNNNFNGTDYFKYTVFDGNLESADPATVVINVTPVNDPPYFTSEDTLYFNENQTGTVVDVNAIDPEGNNITFSLTEGYIDNSLFSLSSDGVLTFNSNNPPPDYESPTDQDGNNIYNVSITATDDDTTPASSTQLITIHVVNVNEAPEFNAVSDLSIDENQVTVVTLSTTDPENDDVSYDLTQTGDNSSFSIDADGNLTFDTPPNYEQPADADGSNTYNVTVTATDNGTPPQTGSISFIVTVNDVNEAPIVTNDNYLTDEDTELQVVSSDSLLSNDRDEERADLIITSYSDPINGTITNFNFDNGTFTYTPTPNFNGKDSITYIVSDGTNTSTGKAYFNVGGVNDPPVVNDDSYTIHEDGTLTVGDSIGIFSNDNDPDQDALIATIIKDVNNGTFNLNVNDGSFVYTPDQNFNGRDTLVYTASDGIVDSENSAIIVITVTSVNDAPIALNDTAEVYEDSTVVINVIANDTDIDGILDPSTIVITSINAGTILDNTDGQVTFKHDGSETTSAGFSYTIDDNNEETSNTASVIIDVIPVNDAPVIEDIEGITVNEGGSVDINLIEYFSDNDGTPNVESLNIYQIANGNVTDNGNGTITFIHDNSETISAGFYYTIEDDIGATSNQATVSLTVNPVNDAPKFISPDTVYTEENQANVIAIETTDAENNTVEYFLESGDDNTSFAINNTTGVLSFSSLPDYENPLDFDRNNTYIVTVTATDNGTPTSQTTSKIFVIIVTNVNEAPVVNDDDYTIFEDDTLTTTLTNGILANDNDPDNDTLYITIQRNVGYGTLDMNSDGTFTYIPENNYNGEDSFTYTVSDGVNNSYIATATITITEVNDVPVANDDAYSVDEDSHLSVSVAEGLLINDEDPDNTDISVALQDSVTNGTLDLYSDGSFQYSPTSNFNGTDQFTYTVSDNLSTSNRAAVVTITVNAVNDPPVVQDNSYETAEDVVLNIDEARGVLNNDYDPDNDALTASIADSTSHGIIALNTNGSFTFTPDTNYYGNDQFTYTVFDQTVTSAKVNVYITINSVNDNPVAVNDYASVNEGQTTQNPINIVSNDYDVDGTLDYSDIVITSVLNGSYTDNGNGTITFTHDGSETDTAGFKYTIKDNEGATSNIASVVISVTNENDSPVANNDSATVDEGDLVVINIVNNDTDADGTLNNSSIDFSNIINGECTNNNDGTVTFLHDGSETTSASFTYTIKDNLGAASNVANVSIIVIPQNDPPFTLDDEATVNEGDIVTINIIDNDYDPDGTLDLNSILIGNITNGNAIDNKDGTVTYIHDGSETSSGGFSYIISDNEHSASRLTTVTITVNPVNDAPVFSSEQTITIDENQYEAMTITANDAEENTISFTLTDIDDNNLFNLNSSTGELTFKTAPDYEEPSDANHNNVYDITVTATDNGSPAQTSTMQISIIVTNINEAPYVENDSYNLNEDDTLTVTAPGVMTNDTDQENDEMTAHIVNNVSHGNLIFSDDGSFTYIPETDYNGTDEFSYYSIDNQSNNSDTVSVDLIIQPKNDAPIAVEDSYNSEEDKTLIINSPGVLTNDYDIDLNSLTAVLITSPSNGSLDLNSDGSFTYLPNQNFAGLDTFTYVANDGNLISNPVNVVINIGQTNDTPISNDDTYSVDEDKILTVSLPGILTNDNDPDNNSLTAILVSDVSHGLLTLNVNGSFSYKPDEDYNGNDYFTYQASDGQVEGNISIVYLTIQAVNDPPVAIDDYFYTAEDIPDNINVISNDSDPNDQQGGIASSSIIIVSAPKYGTALIAGDRINYSPYSRFYGNDTLTYTIFDTGYPFPALSDTAYVYIKVARRHPLAINDTVSTSEDVAIDINLLQNDQDIDIDPTSVTIGTPPAHGTITLNQTTGIVTYSPDNDYFGLTEDGNGDGFTYTVKDKTGLSSDIANVIIDILTVPDPPVTSDVIRSTAEDVPVSINIDEITNDPDNDINYNSIEFIITPKNGLVTSNSASKEIIYTPNSGFSGNDSLSFRISDLEGNISNTSDIIITVSNEAPNANNDTYTISEDQNTELNVLVNDTDPQNNIVPDSLTVLNAPSHGTAVVNKSSGTIIYTPDKDFFGEDNLTYRITDATNYSDQAQVYITINAVNDPPVTVNDYFDTQEDQNLIFDVINNDFDIDNQIDSSSVSIFKAPLHGQVNIDETTYFLNYIPETNYNGKDSLIYEISDASGATSQGTVFITILPVPDSPVPEDDMVSANEETEVIIDVLSNDVDIEDDIDSCSIRILTTPEHGMAIVMSNPDCGKISYLPTDNYLGTDQFIYQISDKAGLTGQAVVYITINNTPDEPVANDDNYSIPEDSILIMNVLLNDMDADNDIDSAKLSIIEQPGYGTLEIANNRIIYVPASNYYGTDQFKYQMCDSTNLCDSAYVYINITPVNDPPVAVDDYGSTTNQPVDINVAENDIDVDGNLDLFSILVITPPQHGSYQVGNGTGQVTYTPFDVDYYGSDHFVYRICDTQGACDTATVFLEIISGNVAPVTQPDYIVTNEDTPVNISPALNDSDPNDNLDLTSVTIAKHPENGTATLDTGTGQINYEPSFNFNGNDTIVYSICDDEGLCSTDNIYITIQQVNDAPDAVIRKIETSDNSIIDIDVLSFCTDPENDMLTVSISEYTPVIDGIATVNEDGTIRYESALGVYCKSEQLIYKVCDAGGLCDTASIFVTILPTDSDGDNIPDFLEKDGDSDNDNIPNYLDDDSDGDGISDFIEGAIDNPCSDMLPDTDGDFISDYLDKDSDDDGVPDSEEGYEDCDNDGIPNYRDVEDDCVERLDVPDTFSPNGDGINDFFKIPGANELTGDKLYIYNRWGGLVYESDNYDNTWDGRSLSGLMGSDELQEGTYFFIYKPDETMQVYKGTVYLKR